MDWLCLFLAGLLEIGWPVGFKYAWVDKSFRWGPAMAAVASMVGSFALMLVAQWYNRIPIGTIYAVWTGIGTLGAAVVGILLFKEPATAARLACIGLILAGIVGLKLTAAPH